MKWFKKKKEVPQKEKEMPSLKVSIGEWEYNVRKFNPHKWTIEKATTNYWNYPSPYVRDIKKTVEDILDYLNVAYYDGKLHTEGQVIAIDKTERKTAIELQNTKDKNTGAK